MAEKLGKEWRDGREARRSGKTKKSNPWLKILWPKKHHHWEMGWNFEDQTDWKSSIVRMIIGKPN